MFLYGFGRIGRLLARLLIERNGPNANLNLRAIVVRGGKGGDLEKRASLLRRDSVHGPFNGSITLMKKQTSSKQMALTFKLSMRTLQTASITLNTVSTTRLSLITLVFGKTKRA